MPTVRLTWTDPNSGPVQEDEVRVYRADAAFDIGTLPAVLATLTADTVLFDDTTVVDGESYWYAVAFEKDGVLVASFTDEVLVVAPSPFRNHFDGDFSTQTHTSSAVWPCAVYDATSNKTFYTWLAEGSPQLARIAAYDHTTDVWSAAVTVDRQADFTDDVHGVPAIALDHQGYIYVFWGNHGGDQRWAISAAPRDISAWNVKTPIAGGYTYPHPVRVGTDLYLLMRSGSTSVSKFVVRKASPSGGVAAFGAEVNLIDWTPGSTAGIYVGEARYNGTEIEFMACQQTGLTPQQRRHLFYFAWNPVTGTIRNLANTVSVASGSLPILHATAIASFREVDTGSNLTEIPTWCRDGSGNLHVAYFNGNANPYPLYHRIWNGSSWSTPELVVSLNGRAVPRIRYLCLVPKSAGVELWYPDGATGGWTNVGGDYMARRTYSSGVWGSEEVVLTGDGAHALAHPASVHEAHADLRVIFAESAQSEAYTDRFHAKRYGFGDNGFTAWPEPANAWSSRVVEEIVYQGVNGSKPAKIDRSWIASSVSWHGNASIQSNRLALDGGAYTFIGGSGPGNVRRYYFDGGSNKNNGEMCIDIRRIKFNNTGQTGSIWTRASTGSTKSIFLLYRGELSPKKLSFEYTLNGGSYTVMAINFTPNTALEYDIRISRDAGGVLRMHMAESGNDLVLVASSAIGTTPFSPSPVVASHGSYDGLAPMNGSIGATRVTQGDRGTTAADVPAAEMAFDA